MDNIFRDDKADDNLREKQNHFSNGFKKIQLKASDSRSVIALPTELLDLTCCFFMEV